MSKSPVPDRRPLFGGRKPKKGGEANSLDRRSADTPDKSEPRPSKSEGGAKPERNTVLIGVWLKPSVIARLDKTIKPGQTRPQAIRKLLEKYL